MAVLPLLTLAASIALAYAAGARIFASSRFGLLTAALFAATPLIYLQLRSAPSSLYPVPFVFGWLTATAYAEDGAPWWPALAGACLGAGVYTAYAAAVMMPLYMLLTIAVFASARRTALRQLAMFAAAFVAASAPFGVFALGRSEELRTAITAHHLYDAHRFNVLQGAHEMVSWVGLTARSGVYYDYFNPAFLFLTGRVLLFPLAVLLPVGLYALAIEESGALARLSLFGFLAAPFAASLTAEPPTPGRIVFITAFAAIVSAYGVRRLVAGASRSAAGSPQPAVPTRR